MARRVAAQSLCRDVKIPVILYHAYPPWARCPLARDGPNFVSKFKCNKFHSGQNSTQAEKKEIANINSKILSACPSFCSNLFFSLKNLSKLSIGFKT